MTLIRITRIGCVGGTVLLLTCPLFFSPGCQPAPIAGTPPLVIGGSVGGTGGTGTGGTTGAEGETGALTPVPAEALGGLPYDAEKVNAALATLVNPDLSGYIFTVFVAVQNNTGADVAFTIESDEDVVVEVDGTRVATNPDTGLLRPRLRPDQQAVLYVANVEGTDTCPGFIHMVDFVSALGRLIADIKLVRGTVTQLDRFDANGNRQNPTYSCPGQIVYVINDDSVFGTGLDISPVENVADLPQTGLEFDVTPLPYNRELLIEALQDFIVESEPADLDGDGEPDPANDNAFLANYDFQLMFAFQSASLADVKFDLHLDGNDEPVGRFFVKSRGGQVLVPIQTDTCPEKVEFRNFVASDDHLIPDITLVRWDREPTGLQRCGPQDVTDLRPFTCPPFPILLTPRYHCKAIVLFVVKDTVVQGIELDREVVEVNEPGDPTDDDGG